MPWSAHSCVFSNRLTSPRLSHCRILEGNGSLYVIARPSVCLSSVTFVRPTQAIEIFGNVSTPVGTLATRWHPGIILRGSSGEGGGVAEYRDFGPIERYISETVQDRRYVSNRKSHMSFRLVPPNYDVISIFQDSLHRVSLTKFLMDVISYQSTDFSFLLAVLFWFCHFVCLLQRG